METSNVLKAITPDLAKKLYGRVNIHLVLRTEKGMAQTVAFLKEKGISAEKAGVHSGYGETSEMLVAKPHLVKMEFAEKGQVEEALYRPENIPRFQIDSFIHGVQHFSKNGILGDPRGANGEIGKELIELEREGDLRGDQSGCGKKLEIASNAHPNALNYLLAMWVSADALKGVAISCSKRYTSSLCSS